MFQYGLSLLLCLSLALVAIKTPPLSGAEPGEKVVKILYGTASFYANKFHGRKTASGETFSQEKMTAACNVLPLGTWVLVTNLRNKRSVVVKVNDRLHEKAKRILDLTRSAALQLGFVKLGLTRIKVEVLGVKKPVNSGNGE